MTSQTTAEAITVAGIDGCRAGWMVVEVRMPDCNRLDLLQVENYVAADLDQIGRRIATGEIDAAGIDMPIGLPDARLRRRASDGEARRFIGPRRSSVFPTPARATLPHRNDYAAALHASRAAIGVGLSKQAFNLLPKIVEVDELLARFAIADRLVEVHPECSFVAMGGGAFLEPKRTITGVRQRVGLLRDAFGATLTDVTAKPPVGAAADDLLDAWAVAWSARRLVQLASLRLGDPNEVDSEGRPCTITV